MAEHRMTLRIDKDTHERLKYWATKKGMTINSYAALAIENAIKYENKDYDLPTAEQQRLNQLIDLITSLSSNVSSLEDIVISGFESLISLTRGDSYLMEYDTDDE